MAVANIHIRTESSLKAKAQDILSDLGLDMTTAINIYLNQIVHREAIPFEICKADDSLSRVESRKKRIIAIKNMLEDARKAENDLTDNDWEDMANLRSQTNAGFARTVNI